MPQAAPVVLLANECGIGRGHIANLAHVVKHMGKDYRYIAGLHRMEHAGELQALGVKTHKSKGMFYSKEALHDNTIEGSATWGDYLFGIGLAREPLVRENLIYWMNQITLNNVAILVAEYAPIAMLAAHVLRAEGWNISVIAVGTGYSVPPSHLPEFPVLMPDYSYSTRKEADVLAMLNRVLADFKAPPLPSVPSLYAVDLTLPITFPFLDPYRRFRRPTDVVWPDVPAQPNLGKGGDEVFIYFSTSELKEPQVVEAICECPLPRRAFLPGASDEMKNRLRAAGVIVELAPVPIAQISERSALFVNSAQAGTIAMAAFIGRPQLGLPQHLEHTFHGRRAAQQGVIELLERQQRSKEAILAAIDRCYHSQSMQARARAFAQELAADQMNAGESLAARLAPILAKHF